ncbi:response regulator transcription factor [Nocardia sp. NPDC052566]|uniref:response regulator transcription factor n=1 Tax=Nocardia sp. NPDC052566 TaxID=3364330 RepID=UPI0037C71906
MNGQTLDRVRNGATATLLNPAAREAPAFDSTAPEVTVVLADEHAVVREGLRAMLTGADGLRVIGEAATVHELLRQTQRQRPDVVVLGLLLPRQQTSQVITDVLKSCPGLAVLVFSLTVDEDAVRSAVEAGARGYVGKSTSAEGIVRAVAGAAAGWAVFSPCAAVALTRITDRPVAAAQAFPELTEREREVLQLVAAGLPNAAIAGRLHLASKTVSNYLSKIFLKLGVCDRTNAILRAREAGLGV